MSEMSQAVMAARELARRKYDGIGMYRALSPELDPSFPDQVGLFKDQSSECLIGGGNRSGKSLNAAILFASIARDIKVTAWNGEEIETRRPNQKGRVLQMWVIGLAINHFSTIYRLLFKYDAYRIIRDSETGDLRSWRPWQESDESRELETLPAYPLIPQYEIDQKSWSWESRSSNQFTHVLLPGKAEIWCFPSSAANPRQGEPVDVIWIDEAIESPEFYTEWQSRLSDKRGRMFWASYPRNLNTALTDLKRRAQEQAEEVEAGVRPQADVTEFTFTQEGNPYIPRDEIRKRREGMSEEEWAARNLGQYNTEMSKIYPFFDRTLHCAIPDNDQFDDEIARILRANQGFAPADWCHELILDPGTVKPAVLLCAVPPPELWEGKVPWLIPYNEIYAPNERRPAEVIARLIREKTPHAVWYNRFIIDNQAGRKTPEGFSITVAQKYAEAFQKENIDCANPGSSTVVGFTPGLPNFDICRQNVESVMQIYGRTRPQLRIVSQNCPHLAYQMANNQLQIIDGTVTDKENQREKNDLRKCLEYWISSDPTYVSPATFKKVQENAYEQFQKYWRERFGGNDDEAESRIRIGPTAA